TSAAAAAAAALARGGFAPLLQQQAASPVFTPIRRNVGYFTMRGGTIGYLVDPRAVVVVDSQFPPEAKACLDGLNQRSNNRPVDFLINTHHHGDHSNGNISFKGVAKKVVAHAKAAEHMKAPPGQPAPTTELLFPDTTFTETWTADAGDEKIRAKFYGRAHTSGDVVITFERANVAHMGDLMFNQRHPVVDRAAGATLRGWMNVIDRAVKDHTNDTIYIFGHGNTGLPVTGSGGDVLKFTDYLGSLLMFVEAQVKAGKTRDEILAMRDPLAGFEGFGRFGAAGARDPLTCAYEEVTTPGGV
ncbi:MAG TPA: MBL fold metallo-hydrolase, partial [Gemmatimonadaceae bacterium]|nr:MBL fold metallo-hydrolase [Gemmatimonadaceae bacterium]